MLAYFSNLTLSLVMSVLMPQSLVVVSEILGTPACSSFFSLALSGFGYVRPIQSCPLNEGSFILPLALP
jgi:hypothetical protein